MVMTGPMPAQGTTWCALEICRILREYYFINVLLVEFDLQQSSLSQQFSLDPSRNLGAVMSGRANLQDCLQTVEGQALLAGGRITEFRSGPTSAGIGGILEALVREAETGYDLIIIDSPPLFTRSEALIALSVVPYAILVIAAGKTRYELLRQAQEDLANCRCELLGVILNRQKRIIPNWFYRWFLE